MNAQTVGIRDRAIALVSLPNRPLPLKTGKTSNAAHIILANRPKPRYRFGGVDATPVLSTQASEPRYL